MRNLKKALSLALALVMIFGMLTISTAAADVVNFVDLDKISDGQKEAVALLIDLKIVKGIETADGKFEIAPDAKIDRNSYAKIVFMALQATEDATPYVGAGTLKDVEGTWAEGFVNFLSSLKYVAGDLEGYFKGSDNLTVAQACKIMLTAMGYDAIHRGYEQDANWSINIMRDAQRFGLMEGVTQAATAEITRENAFRIIYNALFALSVTPIRNRDMGEWIVIGYEDDYTLGLKQYGLVKMTANLGEVGEIVSFAIAAPAQLKSDTFSSNSKLTTAAQDKYPIGPSDVGGRFTFYAKVDNALNGAAAAIGSTFTLYSAAAIPASVNVVKTLYGNKTIDQMVNPKGNSAHDGKDGGFVAETVAVDSVQVYVNGDGNYELYTVTEEDDDGNEFTVYKVKENGGSDVAIARGTIVDMIANSDGKITIIRITKKTAAVVTANPDVNADGQVKITGIEPVKAFSKDYTTDNVFGRENIKKGDVVLFVEVGGDLYIEKAERIEGEVKTRNGDGTITVEGTKYAVSGLGTSSGTIKNYTGNGDVTFNTQYALYLDDGQNVIAFEQISEDVSDNYAFVLQTDWFKSSSSDDMGVLSYARAKLLFTNGATEVVIVKSAAEDSTLLETEWNDTDGTVSSEVVGKFVNFRKDSSNKYTLTVLKDDVVNVNVTNCTFTNGQNAIKDTATSNNKVSVSNTTVFILGLEEGGTTVYRPYTGRDVVPSFTTDATAASSAVVKNNFATFVYADATLSASKGQLLYIADIDASSYDGEVYSYSGVYLDGQKAPDGGWKFETELVKAGTSGLKVKEGGLYEVSALDGDVISSLVGTETGPTNLLESANNLREIIGVSSDVITVRGSTASVNYDYSESTAIYVIDEDDLSLNDGTAGDISTTTSGGFKAYVVSNDGKFASAIYLFPV